MIKSTESEVRALIAALGAGDVPRREAAIARLTIIGRRAVPHLLGAFDATADRGIQADILRVLEPSADERSLMVARRAIAAGGDLAVAAVAILRELLARGTGSAHTEALDLLLTLASETAGERRVIAAAVEALGGAPADIREALAPELPPPASVEQALWEDAMEGRLPDEPAMLREAIAARAAGTPLPVLRRMIDWIREREAQAEGVGADRWRIARGALHQALALRNSRIALYDLRETLAAASAPLPPSFVAAAHAIGDESCLEALASAHARAAAGQDRWRSQLEEAFHAIVKREHLTARHRSLRKLSASTLSRTRPRPSTATRT